MVVYAERSVAEPSHARIKGHENSAPASRRQAGTAVVGFREVAGSFYACDCQFRASVVAESHDLGFAGGAGFLVGEGQSRGSKKSRCGWSWVGGRGRKLRRTPHCEYAQGCRQNYVATENG